MFIGYISYPQFNTTESSADTTFVRDTTIKYKAPKPSVINAKADSILTDSINNLSSYKDTLIDTLTKWVSISKMERWETVGYWQSGEFVKQGEVKAWYLHPPIDDFNLFYNPDPPERKVMTITKTVTNKPKVSIWDNKYINIGLGILAGYGAAKLTGGN